MSLTVEDKDGVRLFETSDHVGSLGALLTSLRIPLNAISIEVNSRSVPPELTSDLVISGEDKAEVRVVENYRVRDLLDSPVHIVKKAHSPSYVSRIRKFTPERTYVDEYQFDSSEIGALVEEKFLRNVRQEGLIENGSTVVVGFSGGTDSTVLLTLLQKLRHQLPEHRLVAATLSDLPDVNLDFAREYCRRHGIEHHVVGEQEVKELFHLKKSFVEAISELVVGEDAEQALFVGHHVIRRAVELVAGRVGGNTIALGLEREEFLPALLGMLATGIPLVGLARRSGPRFRYIYPHFTISKREVMLYVRTALSEFQEQGDFQRYTLGGFSPGRSVYFYAADALYDVWPGIENHFYEGFRRLSGRMSEAVEFHTCENCGGDVLGLSYEQPAARCPACEVLHSSGLIDV